MVLGITLMNTKGEFEVRDYPFNGFKNLFYDSNSKKDLTDSGLILGGMIKTLPFYTKEKLDFELTDGIGNVRKLFNAIDGKILTPVKVQSPSDGSPGQLEAGMSGDDFAKMFGKENLTSLIGSEELKLFKPDKLTKTNSKPMFYAGDKKVREGGQYGGVDKFPVFLTTPGYFAQYDTAETLDIFEVDGGKIEDFTQRSGFLTDFTLAEGGLRKRRKRKTKRKKNSKKKMNKSKKSKKSKKNIKKRR